MNISPINVNYGHVPLSVRLEHLVGNTFRSDFTFIIEDDDAEIPAHKLIIALSSPVLDRIVHGNDTFAASDTVIVDGISRESFMQILHYIYTDKIAINDENVFEILNKSNYFGLPGIEVKCFEYLEEHLNISTVPWIYHQLFYTFSSSNVLSKCLQYIRIQPMQFFNSEYFEKISVDELKSILRMDAINCTEVDLFKAMIKLSSYHCATGGLEVTGANQRKVLDGTERLLRLEAGTESESDVCVAIQKDFFSLNEIERIRADIRKSDLRAVKRKRYTYQDAVWIEIVDHTEMPPSAFYSGSKLFIYRRCKEGEEPHVSGDFNQFVSGSKIEVLCGSGYEWQKCVNGEIPLGSVTISQIHSEPVFIARGVSFERKLYIGNAYMNGKMVIPYQSNINAWSGLMVIPYQSKSLSLDERSEFFSSQQLSDFEILVANNVKNPYNGSGVPNDAIFIGLDENNYKTYLGRAWHSGDLLPAKVILELGAFVSYGTDEIQVDEFEFVRMDAGTYKWEEGNNGEVPVNSISGGRTISGETLYFGRVSHRGNYIPGEKKHICKFCDKSFLFSTNLRLHERIHTGEKPYFCNVCSKSFTNGGGLITHRRTHTGEKPFSCKVCQMSFAQGSHLRQHERVHTGERPYVCNVCESTYSQIGHLITHQKTHTRKAQLSTHDKIRSVGLKFSCAHCGKAYTRKHTLQAHLSKCFKEHGFEDRI